MYPKVDHVESLKKMEYRRKYEELTPVEEKRLDIVIKVYQERYTPNTPLAKSTKRG